ncbi:hypothetical protein [Stenotrophomonas tumulicola]|uniref:DUF2059 domain-containing protein n=1 Tax=Stenotrophomonas tumulicola TaxID=1685415 RepID=A0A7W3FQ25_9GAMM|nr:hypothetical protein [Stenotrophomonas tumulicola]MBA8683613.1 hypothetical protein [Stenotrophomonas tumulicola]
MRIPALLAGLLLAGVASAQPASPSEIAVVMQQLGMDRLGKDSAALLVSVAPGLQALDAAGRDCAASQVGQLLDQHFQQQIAGSMGDEGAGLMGEWKQFMATPAGVDMGRTFQASAQKQAGIATEAPQVGEASKLEIGRFMGTPAFQRFIAGISADGAMPEDLGERMAGALQRECHIDFDPGQIS